jgi:hypothetical protein
MSQIIHVGKPVLPSPHLGGHLSRLPEELQVAILLYLDAPSISVCNQVRTLQKNLRRVAVHNPPSLCCRIADMPQSTMRSGQQYAAAIPTRSVPFWYA